jgi:hypothetical protein
MQSVNTKISVFSLWRDSESYIYRSLKQLESIEEQNQDIEFSYFFYENDSTDNTASILSSWISTRKGKLLSENISFPKEGTVMTESRMKKMAYYRNRMIELGKFIKTDYSIIFDSDVIFDSNVVKQLLSKVDQETVMYTPYISQNIKCKLCKCGKDSYYDIAALYDKYNHHGLIWSCNPFVNIFDRQNLAMNNPIEVNSAFGGFVLIKSFPLNFCNWRTNGEVEHVLFCEEIRKYGKIKVYPDIHVRVELSEELIKKYG